MTCRQMSETFMRRNIVSRWIYNNLGKIVDVLFVYTNCVLINRLIFQSNRRRQNAIREISRELAVIIYEYPKTRQNEHRPPSSFYVLSAPSFLRPRGGRSKTVESSAPDDIAREICRHCEATELREGNTALPLTSPCYNAIRSSLFVPAAFPSPSCPTLRALPLFHPPTSFHFDGPTSQFAPPSCRNYNSSKCPTFYGFAEIW